MMHAISRCSLILATIVLAAGGLPARADWHDQVKVLRIGILAGDNPSYRIASIEPFRSYLAERLGVPVEVVPEASYAALIEGQASGLVQYAIHSAASYATAVATCHCVEAIAAPVAADGSLGFYSILLASADGPVHALADARGLRLAVAAEDSVAGRLIPYRAFSHEGINPQRFFSQVIETADPQAAITALVGGSADLAVGWSSLTGDVRAGYDFGVLTRMVADGTLDMSRVRIVWKSGLIPFGPHVVRSDLPGDLKSLLSSALLAMAGVNPDALDAVDRLSFGGGGFAEPEPGLYAAIEELVTAAPAARN